MGVTCDIIPMLPGEDPDSAVARYYEGDPRLDDDLDPPPAAPPHAFDAWRAKVIERLAGLWAWQRETSSEDEIFWVFTYGWQVEVGKDSVTLRWRKKENVEDGPAPTDRQVLGVFADLRCVFVYPDAEEWVVLDEENIASIEI